MSNFMCEKCGAPIIEDERGRYITACEHYPLEQFEDDGIALIICTSLFILLAVIAL